MSWKRVRFWVASTLLFGTLGGTFLTLVGSVIVAAGWLNGLAIVAFALAIIGVVLWAVWEVLS